MMADVSTPSKDVDRASSGGSRRLAAPPHHESHRSHRANWIRAGVLGAEDGIVSTASLVLGVAAAQATTGTILTAGLAGLVGGSLSMAAGEYVSVSSQRDTEEADLELERRELERHPERELEELTTIYEDKGLSRDFARRVAEALHEKGNALEVHAHEELQLDPEALANPWVAAIVSAVSFALGAGLPLAVIVLVPQDFRMWLTPLAALLTLTGLGLWSAYLGGAKRGRAILRVVIGGCIAMALTTFIGSLFNAQM